MNHIEIGGVQHPLLFNMLAIENVMDEINIQNFEELGLHITSATVSKSLKFSRVCAFHGIKAGYRKKGEKFPFGDIDDLADAIESYFEVEPALLGFTAAVEEFFKQRKTQGASQGK
jgi:hypothetical protein